MRNSYVVIAFALGVASVAGCGDDGGEPSPNDSGTGSDAGSAAACTNALYDPCTDNAQCMSTNCRSFNMPAPGIQVCTQQCDANNPCPMQNGQAVQCTNAGVCRPLAANSCTR